MHAAVVLVLVAFSFVQASNNAGSRDHLRKTLWNIERALKNEDVKKSVYLREENENGHQKEREEIRAYLKNFYDTLGTEKMKEIKPTYFTEDALINLGGKSFVGSKQIAEEETESSTHHYRIEDYGVAQIIVSGDTAIAMVVGTDLVDQHHRPFTTTFELRKVKDEGWKFSAMLVFLHPYLVEKTN